MISIRNTPTGKNDSIVTHKTLYCLIGLAVLVNFSGLFDVLMGPDATLYASISKTMVLQNDYVDLYYGGQDWLDKPHFPFWVAAVFFKAFGIHTWTYKLPALLFLTMGAWYTYLFGKELYNKTVGLLAALILLTAQHIILSDNDVRAEPYLTGLIIASVYHFYNSYTLKSNIHLIIASIFTGYAIMTKGMFAIIPIGSAIIGQFAIKGNWRELLNRRSLMALVLIGITILPEIYCLYQQFDRHPEKTVFGAMNVSGITFFFWDSQVGRFFNTGPIRGKGNPFFYLHTMLWAFLPWSVLLFAAIITFIRKGFHQWCDREWYCFSATVATFVFFSASRFQLPHYLNIMFPFSAILVAQYLNNITGKQTINKIRILQGIIMFLILLFPFFLQIFYKPDNLSVVVFLPVWLVVIFSFLLKWGEDLRIFEIIFKSSVASFFLNIYMNLVFYPSLTNYQGGSEAAFWLNKNAQRIPVYTTQWSSPYIFYLHRDFYSTDTTLQNIQAKKFLVYLSDEEEKRLEEKGKKMQIVKTIENYPITRMDIKFLNQATRENTLRKMDIVLIKQ